MIKHAFFTLLFVSTLSFFKGNAQVNMRDSLALVDLYNKTDGSSWTNRTNWLTTAPVSTWYGVTVSSNRVSYVILNNNNLVGTLSDSLNNLTSISDFELNNNHLTGSIPAWDQWASQIYTIDLSHNQLTGMVPPMNGAALLHLVYLSYNQLTSVSSAAFTVSTSGVATLDLSHNQITAFPNWGQIYGLEYLYMNDNLITSLPAGINFSTFPNLHSIDLSNNQIKGTLPSDLLHSPYTGHSFVYLYLNNNNISGPLPIGLSQVGSFVLSPYRLYNNAFTYDGMEAMVTAFGTAYVLSSPQTTIPVHQNGNTLSVYAGGTLAKDSFVWLKNGIVIARKVGDSTYTVTSGGQYAAIVNNKIVTELTLYSDTIAVTTLATQVCPPAINTTLTSDISGINYQWELDSGTGYTSINDNGIYSGTNTGTLQLINVPSANYGYKYRCVVDGNNSTAFMLKVTDAWTGAADNNWGNPLNWNCGAVPDNNTDVVITGGTIVLTTDTTIRSLSLSSTTNFTVNAGVNLTITH